MTTAAWPSDLPQCPILNAWDEEPQPSIGAFNPPTGAPHMVRRSTAKTWISSLSYRMSTTQVASFRAFFDTTLKDGVLPFTWAHPVTKVSYNWVFALDQPPSIVRFAPSMHRVSFQLLRLP